MSQTTPWVKILCSYRAAWRTHELDKLIIIINSFTHTHSLIHQQLHFFCMVYDTSLNKDTQKSWLIHNHSVYQQIIVYGAKVGLIIIIYSWVVLTNQGTEIERSQFLDHDRVGWLVALKDLSREREREGGRCVLVSRLVEKEGYVHTLCGMRALSWSPLIPALTSSSFASPLVFPLIRASVWARKLASRICSGRQSHTHTHHPPCTYVLNTMLYV